MTRSFRSRTRNTFASRGTASAKFSADSGITSDSGSWANTGQIVQDYIGAPHVDSPFLSFKVDRSHCRGVSGTLGVPGVTDQWVIADNYLAGRIGGDLTLEDLDLRPRQPAADLATKLFARTNPNRPGVVPGDLIQDIVDIPKLLKSVGDGLRRGLRPTGSRGIASNALAAKFGWIPLINDVSQMLDVHRYIAERNDELRRLASGGLKRRLNLNKESASSSSFQFIDSGFPFYLGGTMNGTCRTKQWGTVKWFPQDPAYSHQTDAARLSDAKQIVLGATASGAFASAWDLIPWTWIIEWSVNVKDYVFATGNHIPVSTPGACIMTSQDQNRSINNFQRPDWYFEDPVVTSDIYWHQRELVDSPTLSASLPYLSADRLSTLLLLAIQRIRA